MDNVTRILQHSGRDVTSWRPERLDTSSIPEIGTRHPGATCVDEIRGHIEALFLLRNPRFKFDKNYEVEFQAFFSSYDRPDFGEWFYFPWLNTAVRFLPEDLHQELRTGRNRYLVNDQEQERFYRSTMVLLGMSVGSHIALTVAMTGGARRMKLADPEALSGDNLNRVRSSFANVGINKAVLAARGVLEINPYAEIEVFPEGLKAENAEEILRGADIVVEEMDNPYWKLRIRELARERCVPVLMATDNGDGAIIDVERFDLSPQPQILNGLASGVSAERLRTMPPKDLPKVAAKIAGANLTVARMLDSVAEVGRSLYSWPQLGTAANMCGSLVTMLARRVVNGDARIRSGRYSVNPDAIFEAGYRWRWLSRKLTFIRFVIKMSRR